MLSFLPATLHGIIVVLMFTLNTLFWAAWVYAAILLKLLTPSGTALRARASRLVAWLAQNWAGVNAWMS
ncbi:MAG: acyltransferase, partial [Stenotrophobium sp.]